MLNLCHVDSVICLVRPNPFDPDDRLLKISRDHEAEIITFDVENNTLGVDDARRRIKLLHIGRTHPPRLADFVEPSIQGGLHRRLVPPAHKGINELPPRAAGNDPHSCLPSMVGYGIKHLMPTRRGPSPTERRRRQDETPPYEERVQCRFLGPRTLACLRS